MTHDMRSRRPIGLAPNVSREGAGQDAAKYASTNPVVRRLLDRWARRLQVLVGPVRGTVVDVGVGEGLSLTRVLAGPEVEPSRVMGVEYRLDKARLAARLPSIGVVVGDAGMIPLPDGAADLVLCIEVLEHLPTIEPAIAELARVTAMPRGRCIVSVPWEPWFRLGNLGRGKNVRRFGNDPEHIRWFTPRRLRGALRAHYERVEVMPAFPWLIADARHARRD